MTILLCMTVAPISVLFKCKKKEKLWSNCPFLQLWR